MNRNLSKQIVLEMRMFEEVCEGYLTLDLCEDVAISQEYSLIFGVKINCIEL